ncbi:tetratricopeptide repeat protein [Candidatus Parcubacteria bacterium]|nr:tetratricopeptide repeat protein [Candidatus Parcubacteria bacterium]
MTTAGSSRLDRLSFIVLQITLFFAPVFFIPSLSVPLQTGKSAAILYGIVIALALWLIARLKDGVFEVPKTILYAAGGAFAAAYAASALVSANGAASLAGHGFELGTLAFFLPSLVLFMLVPLVTRTEKQIFYSYTTLLVSFLAIALFHVIRFIAGPDALSFGGLLAGATANLIGKWNDVAIFFGLGAVLSLVALERATLSRLFKGLVYAALVLSLAMLVVINFSPVWAALAILSLVFFIYELSYGKRSGSAGLGARVPYHVLAALVISVIFLFFGARLGGVLADSLGTSQLEVRPSWTSTLDVSTSAIKDHPVFGAGPNRFSSEWLMHKPAGINGTLFWNADFNYGIGFIPSLLATTGILGFLAALAFVGLFLWTAVKALFKEGTSPFSRYLVLSSLFGSVYLWIFSIMYVPSSALWILTLALSGLLIASLRADKALPVSSYSVIGKPAASFISVLLAVLVLIGSVSFGYFVTIKLVSAIYYQKAVIALGRTADIDKGQAYLANAISLAPSDVYYQTLTEVYLARINQLFGDQKIGQTEAQAKFQSLIAAAIQAAQAAVAADPTSYQNHLTLGRVFEAVVPLNIEGAYDNAKKSYQSALALNPDSPEIYLVLARLEVAHKDSAAAKDYIAKALEKKSDYADAIYLLSQIQIAENDVDNAIKSVSAVATLSPSDSGIFFQLGLLYYSKKDYQSAVLALERAVSLNPQYANAKYFLGLSYYLTGAKDKSLVQFQDLEKTNPDNADVKAAIANLEAGRSPVPAPAASAVKKPSLPVKQ